MTEVADDALNRQQAFAMAKAALAILTAQHTEEQADMVACKHLQIAVEAMETFIAAQRGLQRQVH